MTGPVLEIVGVGEELAPGIVEADLARGLGFGVSSPYWARRTRQVRTAAASG